MTGCFTLNDYCKKEFGHKLYKLSLSGVTTCPNRDGSLSFGGCIFCSEKGSGEFCEKGSILKQIELAKLRGLHRIWLTCNKHNDHSLEVYRHWGFQTIAEDVTDIGNGYVMDDYILEYRLD